MKYTVKEPGSDPFPDVLSELPAGRFAVGPNLALWYATIFSLACLSNPGDSLGDRKHGATKKVRFLPAGTKLEIET